MTYCAPLQEAHSEGKQEEWDLCKQNSGRPGYGSWQDMADARKETVSGTELLLLLAKALWNLGIRSSTRINSAHEEGETLKCLTAKGTSH